MTLTNISQASGNSHIDNDKYYDVILFVSELSPKNEFSFHYIDGYVSFENLSYECTKFFLNRFKNFDMNPMKLYAFKADSYKLQFNVNSIYEKFNNKIKVELPINKCSNQILEILNCLQFLIDIFRGLDYVIIISNGNIIELSDLDQQNLQLFVNKMREMQLKPKKINFSSNFLFQLVFCVDELVKFIEEDSKLMELYDSKIIREPFRKISENVSHYESALSTDEFPTSMESLNGEKANKKRYSSNNQELMVLQDKINNNESNVKQKRSYKTRIGGRRKSVPKKNIADKYAMSNIDNDSLKLDSKLENKTKKQKRIDLRKLANKTNETIDLEKKNDDSFKRSERLRRKTLQINSEEKKKVTKPRRTYKKRSSLLKVIPNITDIDSMPLFDELPNLNSYKYNSIDSTINFVLGKEEESKEESINFFTNNECSYKDLLKSANVFLAPIKQEASIYIQQQDATIAPEELSRLIFSSYSDSAKIIYDSKGVRNVNNHSVANDDCKVIANDGNKRKKVNTKLKKSLLI